MVRILVAAAQKTGNAWLVCLLGSTYGLDALQRKATPPRPELALFEAWVAGSGWPDGTIFRMHYDFSPALADAVEAVPARLVTIVRDPYDQFVSLYFWAQTMASLADRGAAPGHARPWQAVVGKPIDHPDVLRYLTDRYGSYLRRGAGWLHGGRAVAVRYEGLHADPLGELGRAAELVGAVEPGRIAQAVAICNAETMRQTGGRSAGHVRAATVGDWRNHLSEAHLAVFRERHADQVRALGYEVR